MAAERPGNLAPPPRVNPLLLGHERADAEVRRWIEEGCLGHALLICGPWGIGKATWAFRIARNILRRGETAQPGLLPALFAAPEAAGDDADEPLDETFRWVASSAHPDLLTVERRFDEKRSRMVSEIVVDDIRRIGTFLASSPARGGWRVVIVDAADEMNRNAANALLKVLEEPGGRSLLLLLAHQPGLLPATIRSRCRRVLLRPLEEPTLVSLIDRYLPGTGAGDAAALGALAEGSIGRALQLAANDGLRVHHAFRAAFEAWASGARQPLLGLAADPAMSADEDGFRVTAHILSWWLRRIARVRVANAAEEGAAADILAASGDVGAIRRIALAAPLDRWQQVWDKTQRLAVQAVAGNLDRRQTMTTILLEMQRELRPARS